MKTGMQKTSSKTGKILLGSREVDKDGLGEHVQNVSSYIGISWDIIPGWWLVYPSEKYESIGMMRFPILMGKQN